MKSALRDIFIWFTYSVWWSRVKGAVYQYYCYTKPFSSTACFITKSDKALRLCATKRQTMYNTIINKLKQLFSLHIMWVWTSKICLTCTLLRWMVKDRAQHWYTHVLYGHSVVMYSKADFQYKCSVALVWLHVISLTVWREILVPKIWQNWQPTKNLPSFPYFYMSIVKSHKSIKQSEDI